MAERPLLLLAKPTEAAKAKKEGGGGGPIPRTAQEELQRLGPRIDQLTEALENTRLRLQSTTTGLQPEEVLVLETAGSVDGFYKAVQKTEGLGFLTQPAIVHQRHDPGCWKVGHELLAIEHQHFRHGALALDWEGCNSNSPWLLEKGHLVQGEHFG